MKLQRMIFFAGFFIASATSTIFTAPAEFLLSADADTGMLPPAYAPQAIHKARVLQEPKKLARPKLGITRQLMNSIGTLWLIDAITGMCCGRNFTMAEAYYTAHTQLSDTIDILNQNGLLDIQDALNAINIEAYSYAQLDTNSLVAVRPFTSFVINVKRFSQPLRLQAGQLQALLKDAKAWSKKNPRGRANAVTDAIADLLSEYNALIVQLEHLINFTIKLDGFKAEQQYAAKIALPQGPQLRLMLEGGLAGG